MQALLSYASIRDEIKIEPGLVSELQRAVHAVRFSLDAYDRCAKTFEFVLRGCFGGCKNFAVRGFKLSLNFLFCSCHADIVAKAPNFTRTIVSYHRMGHRMG